MPPANPPTLTINNQTICCGGEWVVSTDLNPLLQQIDTLASTKKITAIDTTELSRLDSTGAWILCELQKRLEKNEKKISVTGLKKEQQSLFELVTKEAEKINYPIVPTPQLNFIASVGEKTVMQCGEVFALISFLGEVCVHLSSSFRRIWKIQWPSFLTVIKDTGYNALGIVGLLCALIGIVLAYQMGQQLKIYGANIYIVGVLGVGVLQEFAPLITAIIVAGRTSSAFAAQIATMQVNQEIDALRTMGLSPIDRLVIPKILGLLVSLPLLIVWADIFGVMGGMLIAKYMLGIGFYNFLTTFPDVIEPRTFLNGLIKAPIYAGIIAGVGCFQGFRVTYTADSVGRQTTKSVVQAIFFIIVADAIFSIILPWQKLQ
jgi:phospholipid/cholesterol/gamma-HCH transport system permease protein